ncbi:MAG TPA: AAA family ATPase [Terracidiphilus sp.]|nr:AAA family ATPase [Terracidiphilus sp.]
MARKKTGARVCVLPIPPLPGEKGASPCDVIARWGVGVIKDLALTMPQWSGAAADESTGIKLSLLRADTVEDKPMEFLLDQRILLRMLSGLCGHPGSCKTWVGLKIAADGSRGIDTFTGKRIRPFNTLYWTNESLPETIRRRFKAMGGDLTRLFILTGAVDSTNKSVNLTLENIAELEQAVTKSKAKLFIVDPLQSFLGAKVNMNQANETRPLLDGISALADKHRLAVIIIRHLSKVGGSQAVSRALGSIEAKGAKKSEIAREFGISRQTLYTYLAA